VLSASATVANALSSSSSSSYFIELPLITGTSPMRIIFTMPSSKKKEEIVKTTLSPSKAAIMLPSTTSSLTVIPSSPQLPLLVSESAAGRLIVVQGRSLKLLEKCSKQDV
jgi:hypothetical protein